MTARRAAGKRRASERMSLHVGVMSGTSLDGVDSVLVGLRGATGGKGARLHWQLHAHRAAPLPDILREHLRAAAEGEPVGVPELARMHYALGEVYAISVMELLSAAGVEPGEVEAVGLSGQTVFHLGAREAGDRGVTLQIGSAAVVAELTGVRVVFDLRCADIAAGGEGAPLVPYADYLLFRDAREGRIVLNIGGIANLTGLPAGGSPQEVLAFDTGPGNMVMDGIVQRLSAGREEFDDAGARAARGRVLDELVSGALSDPFFALEPPRSTGRERFGAAFVERWIARGRALGAADDDLVASACALTAESVALAIRRFVSPRMRVDALYAAGGGAFNLTLLQALADRLHPIPVQSSLTLDMPPECREAVAFAVLARETLAGRASNLPQVTGASRPLVLGSITGEPMRALARSHARASRGKGR